MSNEAEIAVVGDLIMYPRLTRDVAAILAPPDFADTRLGNLYGLIAALVTADGPESVTPLTIAEAVNRRRTGPHSVPLPSQTDVAMIATNGIGGNIAAHARLIRRTAVSRQLATLGRSLTQAAENGTDPATLAAQTVERAKTIRDGHRPTARNAPTLTDILATEDTYDWLIPDLLERGDRLVLTGGEGAGKSTLMRQIGICTAAGIHPFTGTHGYPHPVLVVDCENSERQWRRTTRDIVVTLEKRLRNAGMGDNPADNVHLHCTGRLDITNPTDLGSIHALVDEHEPAMLLIGPLYKLVPRAITTDDDAAPVLAALDSLRDRGLTLIMEAHAGHALGRGGDRDYRPRGSSAILGWPEFGLGLAPEMVGGVITGSVDVIRWRADRDMRAWPRQLQRGHRADDMPWIV